MRIVVFGLTISSSWGNGHATLWRSLAKGLAQNDHRLAFFERNVPYYAAHRDVNGIRGGELHIYDAWDDVVEEARRSLHEADAAIITSYCPDAIVAAELVAESGVPMRVFYDLDTPVTLARIESGQWPDYIGPGGLGDFDLVLSYTGGRALDALVEVLGAVRVAPLYGSVDPDVHTPTATDPRFEADVSYLGTHAADRQAALEELFLGPAARRASRKFLIGGSMYPSDFPWRDNIHFVQHVAPPDHASFYSSSPLTLSVTRGPMKASGFCPSGRLFEAAACGTPVLSDVWPGLDAFFEPGTEILTATTTDEAVQAMDLPAPLLARIGAAARARVLRDHTGLRRASELVTLLRSS